MSHHVHPYSHRLGILRDWKSRWFRARGSSEKYRHLLKADVLLREFLEKKLRGNYINTIEMERGQGSLRVIISTSRAGMLIGRSGEGVEKIKKMVEKQLRKIGADVPSDIKINIEEIKSPESHAKIVAQMVSEQLEKRMPFRRVVKRVVEKVMANKDVHGVKIFVGGRLDGAEMGRRETTKKGRLPLQTLRADIDYATDTASLPYDTLGIKVWIYRGEIFDKSDRK